MNKLVSKARCASAGDISKSFCHQVKKAVANLRIRLGQQYADTFPGDGETLGQALAEAEELAWETSFPHLLLPAFAEARVAARTSPVFAETV